MIYNHHVITHGKALASCLSERRPLSDSKYKTTFLKYDMYKGRVIQPTQDKIFLSDHHVEQPVGKEEHFASPKFGGLS